MKITNLKTEPVHDCTEATIPRDTTFNGDVETKSSIRIDGHVKGNVVASGNVTVGADGCVEGGISGKEVSIAGKVTGNLSAKGAVQLFAGAKLIGDLLAVNMSMEKGAFFKGMCIIADKQNEITSVQNSVLKTMPLKSIAK